MMEDFHFINPFWFLMLIPAAGLLLMIWRRRSDSNAWEKLIDPELMKVLTEGEASSTSRLPFVLSGVGIGVAVLSLANPVWEKLPQPVFETSNARVVVLDLSLSMYSPDVAPQRLTRAKFKIRDLLKQNYEGQTGLVVFSGDAFVASPLTRDTGTIESLLDALDPSIMPAQGSQLDLGLSKASELLKQAGMNRGQVIVVTDGYDKGKPEHVAEELAQQGFSVSVLAVGTSEGAPLPNGRGGVIRDRQGNVVLPKLDEASLRSITKAGEGVYTSITSDSADLERISQYQLVSTGEGRKVDDLVAEKWKESGPWIVLLLLPIAALAFRRGWLLSVFVIVGAFGSVPAEAFELDALWSNREQRSHDALESEQYEKALELTNDSARRGAALYRQGEFEAAEKAFSESVSADAHYNRGNSLFQQNRFDDAIFAYDQALALQPDMKDAVENRELAQQMKKQQEQSQQQQDNSSSNENQESSSENQQASPENQDSAEQNSQQEPSGSDDGAQQNSGDESEADQEPDTQDSHSEESGDEQELSDDETEASQSEQKPDLENEDQNKNQGESESQSGNANSEEQMAAEQWLKRIPDDPGELLRRKFLLQYNQRNQR